MAASGALQSRVMAQDMPYRAGKAPGETGMGNTAQRSFIRFMAAVSPNV